MTSHIGEIVESEAKKVGLQLSARDMAAFEIYAAEMKKWNRKVNITAITKDDEIAIKHFFDSLSLIPHVSASDNLLDIGSGAGLPVIPLKIVMPHIPMVSVDAVAKKINFQRHVIRILGLQQIEAVHARIEDLQKSRERSFSVITSRAFTRLDRFVELAAPLLADEGVLIAMKGGQADGEIAASDERLAANGFQITSIRRYSLPRDMGERVLTFMKRCKAP